MPRDFVDFSSVREEPRRDETLRDEPSGPYRFLIADGTANGRLVNMRFLEIDGVIEFDCPGLTLREIVERYKLDRVAYYQIRGPNDAALAAGIRKS